MNDPRKTREAQRDTMTMLTGAFLTILWYGMGDLQPPPEVAAAFSTILTIVVHRGTHR
jgi:hypothetical protein